MAESWKRAVTTVSDKLFPGLVFYHPYTDSDYVKLGSEIISHLPLQMSLYFNSVFYPFWLTSGIVMLHFKWEYLSSLYSFIVIAVFVSAAITEAVRLYLGFIGNLAEKIPELATFWILSVLLQVPMQTFLIANEHTLPQPMDFIMQSIMLIMLITQIFSGFKTLQSAARQQANRFQLMKHHLVSESRSQITLHKLD